jgi:hypothetical protein
METERSPGADRAQSERDDDLVVLEGLEAEFTDLESELARVEQSRSEGPAEPGT